MREALISAMLSVVGNGIDSSLIHFRCVQPDHRRHPDATDRVFVHAGTWAYCEAGKLEGGHKLIPTGGLTRQRLEAGVAVGRTA
jgi:hypothetical protein